MQFPKSLHADGWHAHIPHLRLFRDNADRRSTRHSRVPVIAAVVAVVALTASVGVAAVNDKRPLDVQLTSAMHRASETLQGWQAQVSHGLRVSLRAVADGRDLPDAPTATRPTALIRAAAAPAMQMAAASR
ncbi:MAG: hypothetical protein EOP39_10575 [Rubrivivax sp.]|nr:MAG: hypothetical protein EOP39_10575 [Rubrivivax sp.]